MEFEYMQLLASRVWCMNKNYVQPTPIEEIEQVEQTLNITIPKALKEFFLLAGNDYGTLLYDVIPTHQCVQNLISFQEEATIYFQEVGQEPLSNVLFFSSLPDSMHFVRLNGDDNPVVYYWEPDFFDGIIDEWDLPFTPEEGPGIKTSVRFVEYIYGALGLWTEQSKEEKEELLEKLIVRTAVHKHYKLEFVIEHYNNKVISKNVYPKLGADVNIYPLLSLLRYYIAGSGWLYDIDKIQSAVDNGKDVQLNYRYEKVQIINGEAIIQKGPLKEIQTFSLPALDFLQILKEMEYFYKSLPVIGYKLGGPSNYVPPVFHGMAVPIRLLEVNPQHQEEKKKREQERKIEQKREQTLEFIRARNRIEKRIKYFIIYPALALLIFILFVFYLILLMS